MILDFLDSKNTNCSYICSDKQWYLSFLKNFDGSINVKFLDLYTNALKKISSSIFLDTFNDKHFEEINFNNDQLASDITKKDNSYLTGTIFGIILILLSIPFFYLMNKSYYLTLIYIISVSILGSMGYGWGLVGALINLNPLTKAEKNPKSNNIKNIKSNNIKITSR